MMNQEKIKEICGIIEDNIEKKHVGKLNGSEKELFLIGEAYPGVWLEHVYDSVMYAKLFPEKGKEIARNTVEFFIDRQTSHGQLPCYIFNRERFPHLAEKDLTGYSQIQECVSFGSLCYEAYEMLQDKAFLEKCYNSVEKWVAWLEKNRMTLGTGLVEMFVGYDTGHDNSLRLEGMSYTGNYEIDGELQNAAVLPPDAGASPILAVDMNCNFYGNLVALSKMAFALGFKEKAEMWKNRAERHKKLIFEKLFDKEDLFFYDVDKSGNMRKIKSCTIFHPFIEKLLDKNKDKELIEKISDLHIMNPEEFRTEYPFPSVAANDKAFVKTTQYNCWGYFTQGLIALRTTLWMDEYGMKGELDTVCEKWLKAWTACFEEVEFGQELDPFTGKAPTKDAKWYSSTVLFYLYSARRLGIV